MAKRGRALNEDEKQQAISLAGQGHTIEQICEALGGLDKARVSGVIGSARSRKLIGPRPPKKGSPVRNIAAATPPARDAIAPAASDDGEGWMPASAGMSAAFAAPGLRLEYKIERFAPPDGVLNTHTTAMSDQDIGQLYGSGSYRITKSGDGKVAMVRETVLAKTYGVAKYPRASGAPVEGERPSSWRQPWGGGHGEGDGVRVPSRNPFNRHPHPPQAPSGSDGDGGGMAAFGRQAAYASETIAAAAINQLGALQKDTIAELKETRNNGPDKMVTTFLERQSTEDRRRTEEDRKQAEGRRTEERTREEARREDERTREGERHARDQEQYDRRQEAAELSHKRDMERIKAENESKEKMDRERHSQVMELYEQRMKLATTDAQHREERLQKDLERSREDSKEDREKMLESLRVMSEESKQAVADVHDAVQEDLKKDRQSLQNEYRLKEKAIDNEHVLRNEMLKLREEIMKSQGQDELTKTLGQLLQSVEKTVKEVVELKKIEAMSPEAQAAQIAREDTPDGNVHEVAPQDGAAAQPEKTASMGGAAAGPGQEGNINMEQLIQDMMKQPFFKEVLKEWVGQVADEDDSSAFTNMFMEWMRDEGPDGNQSRKACTMFANFMKRRDWAAMFKVMEPILEPDQIEIFKTEAAEEFYESFRAMVLYAVKEYWQGFSQMMAEKEEARAQARADKRASRPPASAAATAPAPTPAPAPVAAAPTNGNGDVAAPPIPQRDALPASAAAARAPGGDGA